MQLKVLARAYVPGAKVAVALLIVALNTMPPLILPSMTIDPGVVRVEINCWLAFPGIVIFPDIMPFSTVEPAGFVRVGAVREKVVDEPVEEIPNDELIPLMLMLVLLGVIVMLPPFTLQVAGMVPVAVIEPLVAA